MNSAKEYKAIAYSATEEQFVDFCNSKYIKFKGEVSDYNNYLELVISQIDIKVKLLSIVEDLRVSKTNFEDKIRSLNNELCRAIYNRKRECLFLVVDNFSDWSELAKQNNLEEYNLLDDVLKSKICNYEFPNLIELNIITRINDDMTYLTIRGDKIERDEKIDDYISNIVHVETYKRAQSDYDLEVIHPNLIKITNIEGNLNLRKSLSNTLMRNAYDRN